MPIGEIINSLILFVLGFFILIKGAQFLIRGAVSISSVFKISSWFVGAVIVGMGTSIPELSVNLAAVFDGNSIGLAAVIGSNILNISIFFGISAIFYPLVMRRDWVFKDFIFNIASTALVAFFLLSSFVGQESFLGLSRFEGTVLLIFFMLWFWSMFHRKISDEKEVDVVVFTAFVSVVMILGGIIGVFLGGRWVVDGASTVALLFGISPTVVGLTVVALGTSLPELTVSFMALMKGNPSIAFGNILGTNVFNVLGVLGLTSVIQPIRILEPIGFDILMALVVTLLLFVFMFVGKRYTLSRFEGILFILLYIGYVAYLFIR